MRAHLHRFRTMTTARLPRSGPGSARRSWRAAKRPSAPPLKASNSIGVIVAAEAPPPAA
jgi:hypothetical protein